MNQKDPVFQNLQRFANQYQLILECAGEVGFGRPCVGFLNKTGNFLDINPYKYPDFKPVWPIDDRLYDRNAAPDAYHKHDCLCVLVHDDNFDKALIQLNNWINSPEKKGELCVAQFKTGATGLQAVISGVIGFALRFKEQAKE